MKKNRNKGFTLVELLVAIAIAAMAAGLAITTIGAIGQTRMKDSAEKLKSTIEVTRDYAKTHGGNTYVSILKVPTGLQILEVSTSERDTDGKRLDKIISETNIKDKTLVLYYKLTGDKNEYQLGKTDADSVTNSMLQFTFVGKNGAFSGPHYIDSLRITNGNKEYTLIIEQKTGMVYYDYEDAASKVSNSVDNSTKTIVPLPTFIVNGNRLKGPVDLSYTGKIIQPELAYDSRNSKMSGVYRAKDPGTYKIVFSLKDPYSMEWDDGTISDYVITWNIVS